MIDAFWKGKKITAYIALKHHTRFIIPIMEHLSRSGAQVKYLVGQAERSQEITAIETGIPYSHVFEYITDADRERVFDNYNMLQTTFGKALLEDSLFSLQVPTVLDKTLFALAQEYTGFQNYFKNEQPDICLALHELNRWGKTFAFLSKHNNIPVVTLQEGLLTSASAQLRYIHTGHVQYSSLGLVWGRSTKEKLCHFEAPQDRLIPVGNTHLSNEIKRLKEKDVRNTLRNTYKVHDKYVVVVFFSILPPKDISEFKELFALNGQTDSLELVLKFHPASVRGRIDEWVNRFPASDIRNIRLIHGEEDTYSLMAMSDLCVLVEASTVGLEALAIGCPLVLLNLKAEVIYKDTSLSDTGAALRLSVSELCEKLREGRNLREEINAQGAQTYLKKELIHTKDSTSHVVSIMKNLLKANTSSPLPPLSAETTVDKDWALILPVPDQPRLFLETLEQISIACRDASYEVILIAPDRVSTDIRTILDSLDGNVTIIENKDNLPFPALVNQAAIHTRGAELIIMDAYLAPEAGWLTHLKKAKQDYGTDRIFGARISNRFGNIVHGGMIVTGNSEPISAYLHLERNFTHACKTRSFQMVDHLLSLDRDRFLSVGGFHPKAGRYAFLEFLMSVSMFIGGGTPIYEGVNMDYEGGEHGIGAPPQPGEPQRGFRIALALAIT